MAFVKRDWIDRQKVTEGDLEDLEERVRSGVEGAELAAGGKVPLARQVDTGVDLNTFVGSAFEGEWSMGTTDRSSGVSNKPVSGVLQGTLRVVGGTGYQVFYEYLSGGGGRVWVRHVTSTTGPVWSAWTQVFPAVDTAANKLDRVRTIPANADLNTYRLGTNDGEWAMGTTTNAETVANKPPGTLQGFVVVEGGSLTWQTFKSYVSGVPGEIWVRNMVAVGTPTWTAWTRVFPSPAAPVVKDEKYSAGAGALGYQVRQDFARRRMAGGVGTGGRAAVALRFDDNPRKFLDVCLPLLAKYQLPGYIASAVRYYDETLAPYTEVQTAALNEGVEIANHSWTHGDATGDEAIWHNTVEAADELEAQMPNLLVNTWTMPSLSGTKMDGYDDGRYTSNFTSTTAGRVIMSRHSVVNGYSGGRTQALDGHPSVGQTHLTIEAMTLAEVQGYVAEAQRMGTGLTLMVHPSRIDTEGYMTAATFESVLAWLDAERQAGRLLCLTAQGIAFAKVHSSFRVNMCPNGDFSQGYAGWQNNTGWTFDTTAGTATTTTGAPLYQNIVFSPFISMRGAICELVYRVKGTAGDVVRTNVTCSPTITAKDHTLTGSDWVEVRKLFTIPAGFSTDGVIRVDIGRVSGGSVIVRDVRVHAV